MSEEPVKALRASRFQLRVTHLNGSVIVKRVRATDVKERMKHLREAGHTGLLSFVPQLIINMVLENSLTYGEARTIESIDIVPIKEI